MENIEGFLNNTISLTELLDSAHDTSSVSYKDLQSMVMLIKELFQNEALPQDLFIQFNNNLKGDSRKNVQSLGVKALNFMEKHILEIERVSGMYKFDESFGSFQHVAGVDEVGRGPLAGPIVSAAVILKSNFMDEKDLILGIKDSKKLTSKHREELSKIIKEKAICYNISIINNEIIDSMGIGWCNNEVFRLAVNKLSLKPELVLSDGYPIKNFNICNKHVIKGDEKSASIACASIIAKVYRDSLMKEYSKIYPYYGFENNMGYGTEEHIAGIKKYGPTKIHRMCFLRNII